MKPVVKLGLVGLLVGFSATVLWSLEQERANLDRRDQLDARAVEMLEKGVLFEDFFLAFHPWRVIDPGIVGEESLLYFQFREEGVYVLTLGIDPKTHEVRSSSRGPFKAFR